MSNDFTTLLGVGDHMGFKSRLHREIQHGLLARRDVGGFLVDI